MTDDYPDRNKDGVPDAFEERPPISEALGFEEEVADDSGEEGGEPRGTLGICSNGVHYFDERPWVRSIACRCSFLKRVITS